ncbi:YpoC family protein [Niallia sp. FSL R7-0271]|uniref:YpoC family protein n=1 Tax=Niallia sp. FSL R7-0271 TaxID=2921678 RepID=UPI0030FBF069
MERKKDRDRGCDSKKDKDVTVRTVKTGVRLFLECLYWTNDSPVHLQKGLIANELSVKPFNAEERLTFILSRPGGYHSYRQLDELFKELEKQFAIKMIKRK